MRRVGVGRKRTDYGHICSYIVLRPEIIQGFGQVVIVCMCIHVYVRTLHR